MSAFKGLYSLKYQIIAKDCCDAIVIIVLMQKNSIRLDVSKKLCWHLPFSLPF